MDNLYRSVYNGKQTYRVIYAYTTNGIIISYMKLLRICLVSSLTLELAKLMLEQYKATQADHFNWEKQNISVSVCIFLC